MDLILARHALDKIIPFHKNITGFYEELTAEVSKFVSPQHVTIFAKPNSIQNIVYWHSNGQKVISWKRLSDIQQKEALQVIQSILIDIASHAKLYPNSKLLHLFSFCSCFPSLDYVYIVDGRPVITAWGYSSINGYYNPLLDKETIINQKTYRLLCLNFPWITALIALFLGILTALLWHVYYHSDKVCYAQYPLVKDVKNDLNEQNKNKTSNKKRDDLLQSLEFFKKQCRILPIQPLLPKEIPEITPLPEDPKVLDLPLIPKIEKLPNGISLPKQQVPQPKPVIPPPIKKVDLPKNAWDNKDVSMLEGCWHLTTPLKLVTRGTDIWIPVRNWQACFNKTGGGNQTITKSDGTACQGPLSLYFRGDKLIIKQPLNCKGSFNLVQGTQVCTRLNDKEASCHYKDDDLPNSKGVIGIFKR